MSRDVGGCVGVALLLVVVSYGIHDFFAEDSEPAPGPIAVEEGHHYNAYQETFLKAVRPLEYPPGVTEKDALFAALGVCATLN